jgi:hypothetical protein
MLTAPHLPDPQHAARNTLKEPIVNKAQMAFVLTLAVALPATAALAQSNQPYRNGTGMSGAYRQATVDTRLRGVRPGNLIRLPGDIAAQVERRDGQAYFRAVDGTLVAAGNPRRGWSTGLGTGLGWGGDGLGWGHGLLRAAYSGTWIGQGSLAWIDQLETGWGSRDYGRADSGGGPVDGWIAQLDLI